MDILTTLLIAFAVIGIPAVIAFPLGKNVGGTPVAIGTGLFVVAAGITAFAMTQAGGYDGIGLAILLIFGVVPAGVSYLIGGLAGWFRNTADPA